MLRAMEYSRLAINLSVWGSRDRLMSGCSGRLIRIHAKKLSRRGLMWSRRNEGDILSESNNSKSANLRRSVIPIRSPAGFPRERPKDAARTRHKKPICDEIILLTNERVPRTHARDSKRYFGFPISCADSRSSFTVLLPWSSYN